MISDRTTPPARFSRRAGEAKLQAEPAVFKSVDDSTRRGVAAGGMLSKRALQKKARPGWMAGRGHVHATTDAAYGTVGERPRIRPKMAEITNSMIATKKII